VSTLGKQGSINVIKRSFSRGAAITTVVLVVLTTTACPSRTDPEDGRATPRGTSDEPSERRTSSEPSTLIDPEWFTSPPGLEGQALVTAVFFALVKAGAPPVTTADLQSFVPFHTMLGSWRFVESSAPSGRHGLLAERDLSQEGWATWVSSSESYSPAGYEDWTPKLGPDGEKVRYLVLEGPVGAPTTLAASSSLHTQFVHGLDQVFGVGLAPEEIGARDLRQVPASARPSEIELGYFARMIHYAASIAQQRSMPNPPPNSLESLASVFGGVNSRAWTNPYTGEPMRNVPLNQATAGDYTVFPHPEGVLIAIHYQDSAEGVSTVVVGQRGPLDPNEGLTEAMEATVQELGVP